MTEQERKEYQKIKKSAVKEVLTPEFIPNRSMRAWMLDRGDYAVYVYMEPSDSGGVFVSVHLSFFWRESEDFLDWYLENGRITSPEVPDFLEALLYKSEPSNLSQTEEFGKNLRILLQIAKDKALDADFCGDYTKMQQYLLRIRGYRMNTAFGYPSKRVDIAIASILAGDLKMGQSILKDMLTVTETPWTRYVRELLEKSEDIQLFREYIRQRVLAGRAIRRNKFPKLNADALPDLYS